MRDPNWPRWVFASISKTFSDALSGILTLFIEGQWRDTRLLTDFAELKTDGPHITEVSKDCYRFEVEVNILIQALKNDTNYHTYHQNMGEVQAAFPNGLQLFKFGTGVADDQTSWGCLTLQQNPAQRDRLEVNHFHQIEPTSDLLQGSIEGHYTMLLRV